jgi:hypothetical protein
MKIKLNWKWNELKKREQIIEVKYKKMKKKIKSKR